MDDGDVFRNFRGMVDIPKVWVGVHKKVTGI